MQHDRVFGYFRYFFVLIAGCVFAAGCVGSDHGTKVSPSAKVLSEQFIPSYFSQRVASGFAMPISVEPDAADPHRLTFTFDRPVDDDEFMRLTEYFVLGLSLSPSSVWVNFSPYETDRILPAHLESTVVGETLATEDYVLKRAASSATDPLSVAGKAYWSSANSTGSADFAKIRIIAQRPAATFDGTRVGVTAAPLDIETDGGSSLAAVSASVRRQVCSDHAFGPIRQMTASFALSAAFARSFPAHPLVAAVKGKGIPQGMQHAQPEIKKTMFGRYLSSALFGSYRTASGARRYQCGGSVLAKAFEPSVVRVDRVDAGASSRTAEIVTSPSLKSSVAASAGSSLGYRDTFYRNASFVSRGLGFEDAQFGGVIVSALERLDRHYREGRMPERPKMLVLGAGVGMVGYDVRKDFPDVDLYFVNKENIEYPAIDALVSYFEAGKPRHPETTEEDIDSYWKNVFAPHLVLADLDEDGIPLGETKFDVILVAYAVMPYIKDKYRLISSAKDRLAKDGVLFAQSMQGMAMKDDPDGTKIRDFFASVEKETGDIVVWTPETDESRPNLILINKNPESRLPRPVSEAIEETDESKYAHARGFPPCYGAMYAFPDRASAGSAVGGIVFGAGDGRLLDAVPVCDDLNVAITINKADTCKNR